MESLNDIKKRIKSVNDIGQMTSAMQLVSAAKMRRSKALLESVQPFFRLCAGSMQEIRNNVGEISNPLFRVEQKAEGERWKIAYFVLCGDQGLAGAYNNNLVKATEEHINLKILENTKKGVFTDYKVFVCGKVVREKLARIGFNVDESFAYNYEEPDFYEACNLGAIIKEKFLSGEFDLIYVVYTQMKSAINMQPVIERILPVDPRAVDSVIQQKADTSKKAIDEGEAVEYLPDSDSVLEYLLDTYVDAVLFGSMAGAYCSEQTARMTAMENATENADEMMKKLTLLSNRARQTKITNELTEIINGAEQANNL